MSYEEEDAFEGDFKMNNYDDDVDEPLELPEEIEDYESEDPEDRYH
jgi:hypothetical protein